MKRLIYFLLAGLVFQACAPKQAADLLVLNAKIYTVDSTFSTQEAMAISNGEILALGTSEEIIEKYQSEKTLDLGGKSVYPGFHDAHCHFYGLAQKLQICDLVGTTSYAEILERLQAFYKANPEVQWLMGRGWDQNDWEVTAFPTKKELDELFPDVPVKLERVDGHALLVNQKALDLAGITAKTKVDGGDVVLENGKPTGVLVDNAASLVENVVPEPSDEELTSMLLNAQEACFKVGLTTLTDAGLPKRIINHFRKMQDEGSLKIRLYSMAQPNDKDYWFENGFIDTDRLKVKSFKVYADGALGSRGACLIHPYHDANTTGFLLSSEEELGSFMKEAAAKGFQINTHCIGDSANRVVLDLYSEILKGKTDHRFRIEHAQVVNPADMKKYGTFGVIPSVQPTHATSDMYWADDRLGPERIKHAYAYKELLGQNGWMPLGSDFPVEDINPLFGFHAAIARQDADNFPEGGFQTENAISREDALKGTTIWAAKGAFWENEIGSLETGKKADFVITNQDIMVLNKELLRDVKVLGTYVNGEQVFN